MYHLKRHIINCIFNGVHCSLFFYKFNTSLNIDFPDVLSLDSEELYSIKKMEGVNLLRYFYSHVELRRVLSDALYIPMQNIKYYKTSYGKPFLCNKDINFNMSHSKDNCLIGICKRFAIGVDIQVHTEINNPYSIAKEIFSDEEFEILSSVPSKFQNSEFFNMWVRREAVLKCIGVGLPGNTTELKIIPQNKRYAIAFKNKHRIPIDILYGCVENVFSWSMAVALESI